MREFPALLWTLALFGQTEILQNPRTTPADIAAGAKTFRSHCAECHGLNGEGGRGPNLTTGNFYRGSSDAELLRNISEGIPGTEMPGLFYSADRVWQIVAYIRSLNAASATQVSGNPKSGKAVFYSSGCGSCHRIRGDGGPLGPDLTYIGQIRSPQHLRESLLDPSADVQQRYWVVSFDTDDGRSLSGFLLNQDTYTVQLLDFAGQLQSHAKSGLKNLKVEKVSRMPSYKDRLSQQQIEDLVAYMSSLRTPIGGEK